MAAAERHLLFGLLALQNGLIDQGQLVAAFQAWTREKERPLAEHLVARSDLDADQRVGVEAMVGLHLKKHGGDVERSLAAIPVGRSTRERLAQLGDADIGASIAQLGPGSTLRGVEDFDCTASYSVGSATSGGQRLHVVRPHARGGLGEVFVAVDAELHREVAFKQILEKHADYHVTLRFLLSDSEVLRAWPGLCHAASRPRPGFPSGSSRQPERTGRRKACPRRSVPPP